MAKIEFSDGLNNLAIAEIEFSQMIVVTRGFFSNAFVYDIKSIVVRKVPGTHSSGTRMSDHKCLS